jgi:P4 family phage/plasmid primase-like protien
LEIRSTGQQTVVPPSVHPSGESISWARNGDPARIEAKELHERCAFLASAALIARRWIEGTRHDLSLALAGFLLRAGWTALETTNFVGNVARIARDEEWQSRERDVMTTAQRLAENGATTGGGKLRDLVGGKVLDSLTQWLNLSPVRHEQTRIETSVHGARDFPALLALPLNDYGLAMRVKECFGDDLLYCAPLRQWFVWNGQAWLSDRTGETTIRVQKTALEYARQAIDARDNAQTRFAQLALDSRRVTGTLEQLKPHLPVLAGQFDAHAHLLNVQNGIVDLRSGRLTPHDRALRMSKLVLFDYKPEARCDLFLQFLDRVLRRNDGLIDYLKRALGASATGDAGDRKVHLLYGTGNNGKTTLLSVLRRVLGDYTAQIRAESLMTDSHGHNLSGLSDLVSLRGVRLAISSETESSMTFSVSRLKYLTQGASQIKARSLHQDWIEFPCTHHLWLDSNYKPRVSDSGAAVWNRLRMIPFTVTIPEGEIDIHFPEKLAQESEGILAWLVAGALAGR